jgi:hypothetical protein
LLKTFQSFIEAYKMKTILFFIAGTSPTVGEAADLAQLNQIAQAPYTVKVLSNLQDALYGADNPIPADYTAGTVPASYKDGNADPIYPTFNPDAPPRPATLLATQTVVTTAQVIPITAGGSVTVTVAAGAITTVTYTAP